VSNSTVDTLDTFVRTFGEIYVLLIIVWIVLSYFRLPYNVWLSRFRGFLDETVQPYLRLWRRILPMFGPLDLSPMIGIFAILAAQSVIISVLDGFRPS
jgi:YggT family protein